MQNATLTQSEIHATIETALLDLFERDANELENHPLAGNRKFGKQLRRKVKAVRAGKQSLFAEQQEEPISAPPGVCQCGAE